jgi:transposase
MASSIPLPEGLSLDAASWAQAPRVVQQLVVQLLASLQQQAEQIRTLQARMAAFEARVQQRSSNSDRPPSSAPPYEKPPISSGAQGRPGAQLGHPGHRQPRLAPTAVIEVPPPLCACGPREFPTTTPSYTHQVIEWPEFQMAVTHVMLHEACCPHCGRLLNAELPAAYRDGDGPRLTALIGEWSGGQRDSRSAVQECCASVLGVPISRGAIPRVVDRVAEAITPHYEAMAEQARNVPVHDIDETAWDQHGVLAWLWVMVNPTVALFTVQASRSQAAFAALIERWSGILVSDGDAVYHQWVHGRQTCVAHLIRRALGLSERKEPELAWFGSRMLAALQRLVHGAAAPPMSGAVQTWYARMIHLLAGYRQRPDAAGKRARTLERELGSRWTFVVEDGVDPTNNRAERALRFAVLWRKLMQGSFHAKGARWVERMLSLRETCRLRGMPTFPVLVDAVTSYFNGQHPDVSWLS